MSTGETAATLTAIALGGAAGALTRYGIALGAAAAFPRFAPAGTLIANVLGCVLIGSLMVLAQSAVISDLQRQLWVTGFLGALTTFSTYGWQTVELVREQRLGLAAMNLLANLVLGLGGVVVGISLVRRLQGG
jgi:CrcB protein